MPYWSWRAAYIGDERSDQPHVKRPHWRRDWGKRLRAAGYITVEDGYGVVKITESGRASLSETRDAG